jgi:hypothetical protein
MAQEPGDRADRGEQNAHAKHEDCDKGQRAQIGRAALTADVFFGNGACDVAEHRRQHWQDARSETGNQAAKERYSESCRECRSPRRQLLREGLDVHWCETNVLR